MGQRALQRVPPSLPSRTPSLPPPSSSSPPSVAHPPLAAPSVPGNRPMSSHIVGYPRIGPKRELKFALESFWDGKTGAEDLQNVAADSDAPYGNIWLVYGWESGEVGFDVYFSVDWKLLI
ncbi:hypothetical protein Bca52824_037328 [Brassica carinata]|uniref:Cobalamin-independent methionine synthase MetE N-terminal domain-containing protein n=1 Tax=Brassica carinata TaxID=52824 RepID=A0A8X7V4Q0_BRACI|nr:hypothetical protein Bca52824_037328 [Brassica carinata]